MQRLRYLRLELLLLACSIADVQAGPRYQSDLTLMVIRNISRPAWDHTVLRRLTSGVCSGAVELMAICFSHFCWNKVSSVRVYSRCWVITCCSFLNCMDSGHFDFTVWWDWATTICSVSGAQYAYRIRGPILNSPWWSSLSYRMSLLEASWEWTRAKHPVPDLFTE